jgi:hypothetical protein
MPLASNLLETIYNNWSQENTGIAVTEIEWASHRIDEIAWLKASSGKAYLIAVYDTGGTTVASLSLPPLTWRIEKPLTIDVNIRVPSQASMPELLEKREKIREEIYRIILAKGRAVQGASFVRIVREPTVSESENLLRLQILASAILLKTEPES